MAYLRDAKVLGGHAGEIGRLRMSLSGHQMTRTARHGDSVSPPLTDRGAAACSLGNQSGGFAFPAIFAPRTPSCCGRTHDTLRTHGGRLNLVRMLNAQSEVQRGPSEPPAR